MAYEIIAASYGAQFYLPNPDGSAAGFYRIHPVSINDGTVHKSLQFLSHTGSWVGSVEPDREAFMKRLISINNLGDLAMGYSHYWTIKAKPPKDVWVKVIEAKEAILAQHAVNGGCPIDDQSDGWIIDVNGVDDDSHENFFLTADTGWSFCKTANKPYDVVVVAILTALAEIAAGYVEVKSDGDPKDWVDGNRLASDACKRVFGMPSTIKEHKAGGSL